MKDKTIPLRIRRRLSNPFQRKAALCELILWRAAGIVPAYLRRNQPTGEINVSPYLQRNLQS